MTLIFLQALVLLFWSNSFLFQEKYLPYSSKLKVYRSKRYFLTSPFLKSFFGANTRVYQVEAEAKLEVQFFTENAVDASFQKQTSTFLLKCRYPAFGCKYSQDAALQYSDAAWQYSS